MAENDPKFSKSFQERADAINQTYSGDQIKETGYDKFVHWLGFRSNYDKQMAQLEQNRKEALLQLKTTEAEQEYNSEAAKAARERAAGINPDLVGIEGASEASEFNEPEAASDLSSLQTGDDVIGGIASAIGTSLSMLSGIQSLQKQGIEIANEEIASAVNGADNTAKLISSLFTKDEFKKYFETPSGDLVDVMNFSDDTLRSLGLRSKRARSQVQKYMSDLHSSYRGQMSKYKSLDDFLSSQDAVANRLGSWYRSGSPDESTSDIVFTLRQVADFVKDYNYHKARFDSGYWSVKNPTESAAAENAEATYKADYYSNLKGSEIASSTNAAAEFNKFVQKSKKRLFNRLTGQNASTFSLILALQLMGETDFIGNSGLSSVAKLIP